MGCLHSASLKDHSRYLGGQKRLPLRQPKDLTRENTIFAALQRAVPKPRAREAQRNDWISAATSRLIDERVSARRDLEKDQTLIWRLGRTIRASMATNRTRQAEEEGAEVEALVGADPPLHQEAWHRIKGWYKSAVDHALPPTRVTLEWITA